ncbi:hypothetical protein BpHYR1_005374 [Brachionus plicatilis]|uniref:Uncharacterized protein n=1 Tax=Brachionus plicatilis TaxID=10195 RepID=A0A3M7RGN8_BRAPC|nr:hypothetical protein BpHYR1_005374 [Brachionus plicatilis]
MIAFGSAFLTIPDSCNQNLSSFKINFFDQFHYLTSEKIISNVSYVQCSNSCEAFQFGQQIEQYEPWQTPVVLDLDLNDHDSTIHFKNSINIVPLSFENRITLVLNNVKNFSITNDSETGIPLLYLENLVLKDSYLGFYYHQIPIEQTCTLYFDYLFRNQFWFNKIIVDSLYIHASVKFPKPICPIPFFYFEINKLYFYNLTMDSVPNFIPNKDMWNNFGRRSLIEAPVWHLFLINGRIELTNKFLEEKIFSMLNSLSLLDIELVRIEETAFKSIRVNMLTLKLNNLGEFFSSSNNKWLNYFNHFSKINFEDCVSISNKKNMDHSSQSLIKLESDYTFPDEHFCSFSHFPHKNLVFAVIHSPKPLKCTCTLIWLLQNYRFEQFLNKDLKSRIQIQTSSVQECIENFDLYNQKCNIAARLAECGIVDQVFTPQCNLDNKYFSKECWEQFSEIFFMLILSVFGTFFGLVTLKVLSDKNFKQTMYVYLKMVIFYQTMSFLMLLSNVFIYPNINFESYMASGVNYCKIDYRSQRPMLRKFKIYVSDFLGYYATMNSLFCNLFLTLDRFVFVSNNKKFSWFKGKKLQKKLLVGSALICVVLNLNQLFTCADYDCLKISLYVKQIFAFGYLIQDGVFIILTFISFMINILLIMFLRESFKKKNKILSNVDNRSAEADETKALVMVIIQCFFIVVSRIPDILLSVLRIKSSKFWMATHDSDYVKLNIKVESLQTTNLIVSNLVILFDIVFAYVLNKKLRQTFYEIFRIQKFNKKIFVKLKYNYLVSSIQSIQNK